MTYFGATKLINDDSMT